MKLSIFSLPINLLAISYTLALTHYVYLYRGIQWHKWQCFEILPHHITSNARRWVVRLKHITFSTLNTKSLVFLFCLLVKHTYRWAKSHTRTHSYTLYINWVRFINSEQHQIEWTWRRAETRTTNGDKRATEKKKKEKTKKKRDNSNALHCVCPAIKYNETLHKGDNAKHTGSYTNWWCGVYNVRGYHLQNKDCLSLSLSLSLYLSLSQSVSARKRRPRSYVPPKASATL